jgi:hypothetical protein
MRASISSLLALVALVGCPLPVDDGDGFAGFGEVYAERRLSLALVAPNLEQRFQLPVTISPPSPDVRIDARFVRVDGIVVGELTADALATPSPAEWSVLGPGAFLRAFAPAVVGEETFRLSLATTAPPAAVEVELTVAALADVDLDGFDDGVRIEFASPRPFIP